MDVFSGNLGPIIDAVYVEQDRKSPLGVVPGDEHDVRIIVDESYTNAWQSEMIEQTSDILVYAQLGSVLASKTCVGGTIQYDDRRLRIETFAVAKKHIELGCSE